MNTDLKAGWRQTIYRIIKTGRY